MASQSLKVVCVGAGYVGGPTMAVMALKCPEHVLYCVDVSAGRIEEWNSDLLPIYEPGLDEVVKQVRGKNLFFSTEVEKHVADADVIFVSVNTPTKVHGVGAGKASDLKWYEKCARMIASVCTTPKIIVEKSTVPVGTARILDRILRSTCSTEAQFQIVNSPEFLAEGTAIQDLLTPSRVLIGGLHTPEGDKAVETVASLYRHWVPEEKIITTGLWSSELTKLVSNAMLAQRVSSINTISALCELTGADIREVSSSVGADVRIGPKFLQASVGFGGSCFQKDILNLVYILESFGLSEAAAYWESVVTINEWQKRRFTEKMIRIMFNTLTDKKIACFGFAFKKDTGDTRCTPAATVCKRLMEEDAIITVYDPKVTRTQMLIEMEYYCGIDHETTPKLDSVLLTKTDPYEAATGCHAICVMTEWDEFKTLDFQHLYDVMVKPAFVFDGRCFLDMEKLAEIGFKAYSIGHSLGDKPLEALF